MDGVVAVVRMEAVRELFRELHPGCEGSDTIVEESFWADDGYMVQCLRCEESVHVAEGDVKRRMGG